MNWLAPAMFAGLLALVVPIAAHFLGRREPKTIRFAAMRFLEDAEPHVEQRPRLRDLLLLSLRICVLVLIVFALARPVSLEDRDLPVYGAPHDAVLLVDTSASMLRIGADGYEVHTALVRAEEIVAALPPGSRLGWLVSDPDGPSRPLGTPASAELAAMDNFIREDMRPGAWPLNDALERAMALFDGDEGPRVIYAISDPTQGGLAALPLELGEDLRLIAVPTRAANSPPIDHIGLHAMNWDSARELDPRAIRVSAQLRRSGITLGPDAQGSTSTSLDAPVVDAVVAFEVDGAEVSRASVSLEPGGVHEVEFTHTLVSDRDEARVALRLVEPSDDPFAPDDLRERWVSSDAQIDLRVLNGDPSDRRSHDEVFFLVTALKEGLAGGESDDEGTLRTRVHASSPEQLERELATRGLAALAQTDVLVLANVENPSPQLARAIETRVREGMGLWITVGDRIGVKSYNQLFDALLPLRLRSASLAGTAPGRHNARFEGMAPATLSHPLFAGRDRDLALGTSKTRRRFLLEPDAQRDADVALSFASGAPALLTRRVGEGRVALLATTLDRDWSDLAIRPGFVALVSDTVSWLAGDAGDAGAHVIEVDGSIRLPGHLAMRVEGPAGSARRVDPETGALEFSASDHPGLYLARPITADGAPDTAAGMNAGPSASVFRFAVDVSPSESEIETLPLPERSGEGTDHPLVGQRPRWRELIWLAVFLLLAEGLLRAWLERRSSGQSA